MSLCIKPWEEDQVVSANIREIVRRRIICIKCEHRQLFYHENSEVITSTLRLWMLGRMGGQDTGHEGLAPVSACTSARCDASRSSGLAGYLAAALPDSTVIKRTYMAQGRKWRVDEWIRIRGRGVCESEQWMFPAKMCRAWHCVWAVNGEKRWLKGGFQSGWIISATLDNTSTIVNKEFFHRAGIHSTAIQLELPGSGGRGNLETCQLRCTSSGEFEANAECLKRGCCWEEAAVTRRRKCKISSKKISLWTRDDNVSCQSLNICINLLTWNLLFFLPWWIYEELKAAHFRSSL